MGNQLVVLELSSLLLEFALVTDNESSRWILWVILRAAGAHLHDPHTAGSA
jgi:hypothetical protein